MFPVEKMCQVLQVSRSSYYFWSQQKTSKRVKENEKIVDRVRSSFTSSNGRYGSPRITADLRAQGIKISRPRVARLMRKAHIKSAIQKEICGFYHRFQAYISGRRKSFEP
jgi:putative transposase